MSAFTSNPVAFCEKWYVEVSDGTQEGCDAKKLDPVNTSIKLYQVLDDDKLRTLSVAPHPKDKELQVVKVEKAGSSNLCYYLPWNIDHLYRITLKPSGKDDPDLFVTSGLNGCEVIVDGDPKEPTVYHCNAKNIGGSFTKVEGADLKGMLALFKTKIADMDKRFSTARTANPTTDKPKTGSARKIDALWYSKAMNDEATYKTLSKGILGARGGVADAPKIMSQKVKDSVRVDPQRVDFFGFATVFGVRDKKTKEWSFYCQRRWKANYWKLKDKNKAKDAKEGKTVEADWEQVVMEWVERQTEPFFPKGQGSAI